MQPNLNDLKILAELYKTRKITEVAEILGLSQPSISIRLAGLRKHFKDPLFVRTSTGMQPTPRTDALIQSIRHAIGLFDGSLGGQAPFDPRTSDRVFRICMTNVPQVVILPKLLNRLKSAAPSLRIEVLDLELESAKALEAGDADLAIKGYRVEFPSTYYQQTLYDEGFVCMVARNHPRIRKALSLEQFVQEYHIAVSLPATAHRVIQRAFKAQAVQRKVALGVPSLLGLAQIVAQTEMLAVVPERLGAVFAGEGKVRLFTSPVKVPSYPTKQHWHERNHRYPGNKWLRSMIASLFVRSAR